MNSADYQPVHLWHQVFEEFDVDGVMFKDAAYYAFFSSEGGHLQRIIHFAEDGRNVTVGLIDWDQRNADSNWHYAEISVYQGEYQIWIDGKLKGKYVDPKPIPAGYFKIRLHDNTNPEDWMRYDDVSICGLSAPFETNFITEP